MDAYRAMRAFVEVARSGSFAKAAKRLTLSTSTISRQVMELEEWLGVAVFRRTTRRLTLTDAVEFFLPRCVAIVESIDGLQRDAAAMTETPRGRLHVTVAAFPAQRCIAPLIPAFLERYSEVQLRLRVVNTPIDLVGESMDLAIRIGELEDNTLVARKIGDICLRLTASPSFIAKHGVPSKVGDLPSFPCLVDTVPAHGHRWPVGPGLRVDGVVEANNGEIIRDLTLAGMGISLLPDFFVEDDVREGRLVSLFEDDIDRRIGIYMVYPHRRHISSAARAFIEFLVNNYLNE